MKSKAIRNSARDQSCTLRVAMPCSSYQTVVFAHLNSPWKGTGLKSPDLFGVYACARCHTLLDAHKVSEADQLRALMETQMKLYSKQILTIKP